VGFLCALCAFVVNLLWYRVFGSNDAQIPPAALLEHLAGFGSKATGRFRGDDRGWFHAELALPEEGGQIELERYLAEEEGIRDELNTWAAWLETQEDNPQHGRLMQHVIASRQVFTLHLAETAEGGAEGAGVCQSLCRFLAAQTAGVYQVDGQGIFAADGALLVKE
jgi:hypothetical protein